MMKKLYVDLDDTFKDSEKFLRKILEANGLECPKNGSVYWRVDSSDYRPYFEMMFGNYRFIPNKEGAVENLKLLETEFEVIFCSSYINDFEAESKKKFADSLGKSIILCGGENFDKSQVDMSDGILIDDKFEVLDASNALVKIQMYNPYNFEGISENSTLVTNWYQIVDKLMGVDVDEDLRRDFCQGIQRFHAHCGF